MKPWKTLKKRTLLHHSKYLTVESHDIALPDGQILEDWAWAQIPDAVHVVAITEAGEYLCFRQTKYAVDGVTMATVAGYLDPNELPLTAAKRELMEETGYEAAEWIFLGKYAVDGNRGAGHAHCFLARGAKQVAAINADDLEEQEVLLLSKEVVKTALLAGEFQVLPWATAMALALVYDG